MLLIYYLVSILCDLKISNDKEYAFMATQTLRVYSGKEILLAYYNRVFQKNIGLNEIQFGIPKRVNTPGTTYNTVINLYPNLGTRYYGSPTLKYDRVHVSLLGTIVINKGQATRVHDLLSAINLKYNINLTGDDVENDLLDPFMNGDITVNLRIKEESVMFYEGQMIYTPAYPDPNAGQPPVIDQYAFWSPTHSSSVVVLSNNNYTALMNNEHLAITQIPITTGKVYWEVTIDAGSLLIGVGISSAPRTVTGGPVAGMNDRTWVLNTATGKLYHNAAEFDYGGPQLVAGMTVGILLDRSAGTLSFMVGNSVVGTAFTGLDAYNELFPIVAGATAANSRGTGNFGEFPFVYVPPTDYKKGLYTVVQGGGTTPPPPTGGPTSNPPAGTILSTMCQDTDKWNVVADGTGRFEFVLIEADSLDCGYDPDNPPIDYGGGSSSGGVGKPTLSVVGGPFMMNEDAPLIVPYALSRSLSNSLVLNFVVVYGTANAADITSFEYRMSNQPSWTTIDTGEQFIVPAGITNFSIRVTPTADQTTEGLESFTLSVAEITPGQYLSNTAALNTAVVITDSSTNPIPYPTNPATPAGWDVEYSTNFESNTLSNMVLQSSIAGSNVSWMAPGGEPSHLRFLSVGGTADQLNRLDFVTEAGHAKRKSISVQMKISVSQTDTDPNAGFGITLFDILQNPDPINNTGTQLRLIAPTTGAADSNFRINQTIHGLLRQGAASLLVPDTIHTASFRFYSHPAGWYAEYWLDGSMQSRLDLAIADFDPSFDFRVGISTFGNTQVKIYTVDYSTRPLTLPRTVRLQGAGQFTIPAGQISIQFTGRGDKGVSNPFKISPAITNELIKLHVGDPGLVPSGQSYTGLDNMVRCGDKFFGYQRNSGSSFVVSQDLDTFTYLDPNIAINEAVDWNGKLYVRFNSAAAGYSVNNLYTTTDGVVFTVVPNLSFSSISARMITVFEERLFVSSNLNTYTSTDGENWISLGFANSFLVKTTVGYMSFGDSLSCRTSTDGENWSTVTPRPQQHISAVVSAGDTVAFLSSQTVVTYTVDNGQNWLTHTLANDANQLLYCNGIFLATGVSADVAFWGTTITGMQLMGPQLTDGGMVMNPGLIRVVKNRFVNTGYPSGDILLISSTLFDWKSLSIRSASGIDNMYDLGDRVALRIGSLNTVGYSLMSIATEDSVASTTAGILGEQCEATVNSVDYSFPISATGTVPAEKSVTVNTASNNPVVVDYNAPVGTLLRVTFLDQPYTGQPIDTMITQNCENLDLVSRYADGNGGEYMEINIENFATCGYIANTYKTATLTGNGILTVSQGADEITITARGSSYVPATMAAATVKIPVNFDRIILPGGYRLHSVAFGAGKYVGIGYVNSATDYYVRKLFYSSDLRIWTQASATLTSDVDTVGFAVNKFYAYASTLDGNQVWTSSTGEDDWLMEYVSIMSGRKGKPVSFNGVAIIPNRQSTASRFSSTTNGTTWTSTSLDFMHGTKGVIHDGAVFISHGFGPSGSYPEKFIRSTVDGQSWNDHTVAGLNGTDGQIEQFVHINGIYFGLYRQKLNSIPFTYIGHVRGTTLNNIVMTPTSMGFYKDPILFAVGNYFVIIDGVVTKYSLDAQTWSTMETPKEFVNSINCMNTIFGVGLLSITSPGFLLAKTIEVGGQYVSKISELGKPAIVTVGDKIKIYPGNMLNSAPAPNVTEVYTVDPGDQTTVVYDNPEGSLVTIGYMSVADNNPANGTLLSEICDGFNKMGVYANGFGGSYQQLIQANSTDCGYTVPVLRAELTPSTQSMSVTEGSTATISYSLSQPLDVDVSFTLTFTNNTTVASDYGNIRFTIAGVENVVASGDTLLVPAGQTTFTVKFDALDDPVNDVGETLDVVLTALLNSTRITNQTTTTVVTIVNRALVIQPISFSYDLTNGNTRFASSTSPGVGMTDKAGILATNPVNSIDKFYVPMPSINLKEMIVGFGKQTATLYDGGNHVYPGMDSESWGITEGGYWHLGIFTPVASAWNYEPIGLLLDRVNGTLDLVINGVAQNYGITGLPTTGYMLLMIGTRDITDPQGFVIELDNRDTSSYIPPVGYKLGYGSVVTEENYAPPPVPDAVGRLTPATFTSQLSDGRGAIFIHSNQSVISNTAISSGVWQFEVIATSKKPFRIGLCTPSFTSPSQVGSDANSWAVNSTLTSTFINGVETPIVNGGRNTNNTTIQVTVDYFANYVIFRGGNGDVKVFQDLLSGPLHIALSSEETLASGGVRLYVNTGARPIGNPDGWANPGFGSYIGNPPYGTPVSMYCNGTVQMAIYNDGVGSTYEEINDPYSVKCGYVPPAPEAVGWRTDLFPSGWVAVPPGAELGANYAVSGYVRSLDVHNSGKHFFEFKNTDNALVIGIASVSHDITQMPGEDMNSVRIDLANGETFQNGAYYNSFSNDFYSQIEGKTVGLMIDQDLGKLFLKYESGTEVEFTSYTPIAGNLYVYIGSASDVNIPQIYANLGQQAFDVIQPPAGYVGWSPLIPVDTLNETTWDTESKPGVVISNNDLTASVINNFIVSDKTKAVTTGEYYWEMIINEIGEQYALSFGLSGPNEAFIYAGDTSTSWGYLVSTNKFRHNNVDVAGQTPTTMVDGDYIGFHLNMATGTFDIYVNNVLKHQFTGVTGPLVMHVAQGSSGGTPGVVVANFGQEPFLGTKPPTAQAGFGLII